MVPLEALANRPRIAPDEYVRWLMYANAGMTHVGTPYCLDHVLGNLPSDNPMIEIGPFCGLSTNLITYYARKHGRANHLLSADTWSYRSPDKGGTLGETDVTFRDYCEFVKDSFMRNVKTLGVGGLPFALQQSSDAFFELWRAGAEVTDIFDRQLGLGGPISFAYIDGDHGYEPVARDFANSDAFLEPGGFVFLDDSGDLSRFDGVRKVAREIESSGRYEVVMKNPHYLFRKI